MKIWCCESAGFSLFSSRVNPATSSGVKEETAGVAGDGQKPCPKCLGRDTIANAAANVGPAVVNISVSHGI